MLNFDNLPTNAPESNGGFELLQPGWDTFTIERAEARVSKSTNIPYLNILLKNAKGSFFDMIMEEGKDVVMFKTAQFLRATKLPLEGSFELSAIAKLLVGKQVQACVNIQKSKDPQYPDRNGVNMFEDGGYRPVDTFDDCPFSTDEEDPNY